MQHRKFHAVCTRVSSHWPQKSDFFFFFRQRNKREHFSFRLSLTWDLAWQTQLPASFISPNSFLYRAFLLCSFIVFHWWKILWKFPPLSWCRLCVHTCPFPHCESWKFDIALTIPVNTHCTYTDVLVSIFVCTIMYLCSLFSCSSFCIDR